LHEAHGSRRTAIAEYFEQVHHTKHTTKLIIKSREEIAEPRSPFKECVRGSSPFVSILLYQIATANLRRYQEMKTEESIENFMALKGALQDFDGRWKASGELLRAPLHLLRANVWKGNI